MLNKNQREKLTKVWLRAINNNPNADKAFEGVTRRKEDGTEEPLTPRQATIDGLESGKLHNLVEKWLDENPDQTFDSVLKAIETSNGTKLKL